MSHRLHHETVSSEIKGTTEGPVSGIRNATTCMLPSRSWSESSASSVSIRTPKLLSATNMKVEEWLSNCTSSDIPPVGKPESSKTRRKDNLDCDTYDAESVPEHEIEVGNLDRGEIFSTALPIGVRLGSTVQGFREKMSFASHHWAPSSEGYQADEERSDRGNKKTSEDKNEGNPTRATRDRSKTYASNVEDNKSRAGSKTRRQIISSRRQIQGLRDSFTRLTKMNEEGREDFREMAREWGHHDPKIRERIEHILEQEAADALEGGVVFDDLEDGTFY